jgi:ribosome maturation factor RimP
VDQTGRVRELVEPLLNDLGTELFDVELKQGILRISIDRPTGVDLDAITNATRAINEVLDREDPIEGSYSLEVSSPGLERALRTPEHFRRFVGTTISVKTNPDVAGERRFQATLDAADDAGITLAGRRIAYGEIDRARTVFEWGGQPKGQPKQGAPRPKKQPPKTAQKKAAS